MTPSSGPPTPSPKPPPPTRGETLLTLVLVELAILVSAALLTWCIGLGALAMRPPTWSTAALGLVACVPSALGVWWSLVTAQGWAVRLREQVLVEVWPLFASLSVGDLVLVSVLAGVCEEALFRGVLQTGLTGATSPGLGLLGASLLFGALHPVSRSYVVMAALLGAYWGLLLLWTGDLGVPMLAHAGHDAIALLALKRWVARDATRGGPRPDPLRGP